MNSLVAVVLLIAVARASAGVVGNAAIISSVVPATGLKGPATGATIVGADGAVITATADTGAVASAPIISPVIAAPHAFVAPFGTGAVVDGPSGRIVTHGNGVGFIGAPGIYGTHGLYGFHGGLRVW